MKIKINKTKVSKGSKSKMPPYKSIGKIKVYKKKAKMLTASKAKTILKDGSVKGHKLTPKQRRFFGAKAGGKKK